MRRHAVGVLGGWEPERLGPILVRGQLTQVMLAVPELELVNDSGPARLEWSDEGVTERLVDVRSCLMDLQQLGQPGVSDWDVFQVSKKYGPLRIDRSGRPRAAGTRSGLRSEDRTWEDSEAQWRWLCCRLALAVDEFDQASLDQMLEAGGPVDRYLEAGDLVGWEPVAAWRCYGRALRTLLTIGGRLQSSYVVPAESFAYVWTPAGPILHPLPPPPMRDAGGRVVLDEDGEPVPESLPSRARFDPAEPASWAPSDYVRAWWRVWGGIIGVDGRPAFDAWQVLLWHLNTLAKSTGPQIQANWEKGGTPTHTLASAAAASYPNDQPLAPSREAWFPWSIAVAQLHAAMGSSRGWLECSECGKLFQLEDDRRRPRRRPQGVDPAYCNPECRRHGENNGQRKRYYERMSATV
jgi:hypothetical protein